MGKQKGGLLLTTKIVIDITNDGKDNKCSVSSSLGGTLYEISASLELAKKNLETLIEMYIEATNKEQGHRMSESEFRKMIENVTLQDIYDKLSK